MERRDFFGIIAAPLLRRFIPPEPIAYTPINWRPVGQAEISKLLDMLGVEDVRSVIGAMYPEPH